MPDPTPAPTQRPTTDPTLPPEFPFSGPSSEPAPGPSRLPSATPSAPQAAAPAPSHTPSHALSYAPSGRPSCAPSAEGTTTAEVVLSLRADAAATPEAALALRPAVAAAVGRSEADLRRFRVESVEVSVDDPAERRRPRAVARVALRSGLASGALGHRALGAAFLWSVSFEVAVVGDQQALAAGLGAGLSSDAAAADLLAALSSVGVSGGVEAVAVALATRTPSTAPTPPLSDVAPSGLGSRDVDVNDAGDDGGGASSSSGVVAAAGAGIFVLFLCAAVKASSPPQLRPTAAVTNPLVATPTLGHGPNGRLGSRSSDSRVKGRAPEASEALRAMAGLGSAGVAL